MKTKLNLIACILTISSFITPVFSQDYETIAIEDAFVEAGNPNTNFGNDTTIKIKKNYSGTGDRVIWLEFDVGNAPNVTNYGQVLLKLSRISGSDTDVKITGTTTNFVENNITWNNATISTEYFYSGGAKFGNDFFIDVTDYIKQNESSNRIVFKIFSSIATTNPLTFHSTESSDSSKKPVLEYYQNLKNIDVPVFKYDYDNSITRYTNSATEYYDAQDLVGEINDYTDERSTYGGWINEPQEKSTATGFFRTEKDCEGVWHIVDPEGYYFYIAGMSTVLDNNSVSVDDLKDLGINSVGNWSDETLDNIAYTPRLNMMLTFKNLRQDMSDQYNDLNIVPVFESDFASYVQQRASEVIPQYLNDPWILGYFLDNEIIFYKSQLTASLEYLPTTNAQYIEADSWMKAKYGNSYTMSDITTDDEHDYMGHVAETYFSIVYSAVKAVDPNHMILGTRYHGDAKYISQIMEAIADYTDIISINYYNRFEPELEWMDEWLSLTDKPFLVSEFYTKGDDVGLSNPSGAGWKVQNQKDRAEWFENWMLKILKGKGNVGVYWFKFQDGGDINNGLYNSTYQVYQELETSIKKIYRQIYSLRSHVLFGNANYNGCLDLSFSPVTPNLGVNIALNKSTNQSSVGAGGVSSRAVDGISDGQWSAGSVTHTQSELNPWWEVDLNDNYAIDQIAIYNREDCCSDRLSDFTVSIINSRGITTFSKEVSSLSSQSLFVDTKGATGNAVKIEISGTGILSLAEVEVYGEEYVGDENFILAKRNATGFAVNGGNTSGAVGRDISLYPYVTHSNLTWTETNVGNGHYLYEKLNSGYCMDGGSGGANLQAITLQPCDCSDDGQLWKKTETVTDHYRLEKKGTNYSMDGSSNNASGQTVRLWTTGSSQNQQWRFDSRGITSNKNSGKEAIFEEESLNTLESFSVYPNPVKDELTIINNASNLEEISIELYNVNGHKVRSFNKTISKFSFNISDLPSGMYTLRLGSQSDVLIRKIVKL